MFTSDVPQQNLLFPVNPRPPHWSTVWTSADYIDLAFKYSVTIIQKPAKRVVIEQSSFSTEAAFFLLF